jgi:RNA ligase (TIGR02306 family)
MTRALATLRTIHSVSPIEGADAIELVRVDGWQCVAKKGEFQKGDACVYFEIDSVLPIRDEFEFLRKNCYVNRDWIEGFRIKTAKFRGQLSQGLALPYTLFPEAVHAFHQTRPIDAPPIDLTRALGVQKWDPPVPAHLSGVVKGEFPSFIPKTDQERIQNIFDEYREKYADHAFEVTVKLDGSSATYYLMEGVYGVCSRNLDLVTGDENADNAYVLAGRKHRLEEGLRSLGRNIALQCELMGPGIQGNREALKAPTLFLYDVYDIDRRRYLSAKERYTLQGELAEALGLDLHTDDACLLHCPALGEVTFFEKAADIDAALQMARIKSMHHPVAEGIVLKSIQDPSVSFKVINNEYLLKHETEPDSSPSKPKSSAPSKPGRA